MKWRDRRRSSNVVDRRGAGGAPRAGGGGMPRIGIPMGRRAGGGLGGIGLIIAIGLIMFAMGINPLDLLDDRAGAPVPGSSVQNPGTNAAEDELADFVSVVLAETEDMWNRVFTDNGMSYEEPVLVLFTGQDRTGGCGLADARMGPFYCPADRRVYIDLSFYEQLRREFGAPGDFAQAYVIAHEVGHHVQQLTGVLPDFNQRRARMTETEANAWSVRVELQADCYAGVWAAYAGQQNLLEDGDIEDALNAAAAIGDDAIQERIQGYSVPKTFSHGTSEQRRRWFETGYRTGDVAACDTFSGAI